MFVFVFVFVFVDVDVDVVPSEARRGFQASWSYKSLCKMRTELGPSTKATCSRSAPTKGSCVGLQEEEEKMKSFYLQWCLSPFSVSVAGNPKL